jgi:hypothetical protein
MLKATIINYFIEVGDLDTIKKIRPSFLCSDFKDDSPLEIISQAKTESKQILCYMLSVFDQLTPKI